MAAITSADMIADIQRVYATTGGFSRRKYIKTGSYSERQIRKTFGSFAKFQQAAGLSSNVISGSMLQQGSRIPGLPESNEFVGDKWNITKVSSIHTIEALIAHFQIDESIWEIERFIANSWEMGAGGGDKIPLYQVKATFVKRRNIADAKDELESLKKAAQQLALTPTPIVRTTRLASGNMLELALFDAHFGKLAWPRETNGAPYDIKIAQKIYLETVEQLLEPVLAGNYSIDSILLIVGNDLIHSDDTEGRTTKGTYVDCDSRYYKTFEIVRQTVTKVIDRLRQIAPVTVKMVQGNHDMLSVWHLGDSLRALFDRYDDVEIDNEPTYHKYHKWGNVGLMFTHGDKGKRADYPLLFATDKPLVFGTTKFREVHTGHLHKTQTDEFHGVRVRIIPSLSPADAWHYEQGFTGQLRTGEAFVWNKDKGLVAQFFHNAE